MRYTDIHSIMARKRFLQEPAFRGLTYVIEPIPCQNSACPLGLYDEDTETIILPPNFTEPVLLHELGHRYEHFYYGHDLSEDFAEAFRKAYSNGGRTLLGYFPADQFPSLAKFDGLFKEGERGAVEMHLSQPLSEDQQLLAFSRLSLYPQLRWLYNPKEKFLRVEFTKGVPFLPIILGVGAVIVAGMLGFGLFKIETEIASKIIPLSLIAGGVFILYGLTTRAPARIGA